MPGNLYTWLDDVQCKGCEKSLEYCSHRPWGSHNCSHQNDVSIACYDRKSLPAIFYPFGNDEGDSIVTPGYSCNGSISIPFAIFNYSTLYVSYICVNLSKIDKVRSCIKFLLHLHLVNYRPNCRKKHIIASTIR